MTTTTRTIGTPLCSETELKRRVKSRLKQYDSSLSELHDDQRQAAADVWEADNIRGQEDDPGSFGWYLAVDRFIQTKRDITAVDEKRDKLLSWAGERWGGVCDGMAK